MRRSITPPDLTASSGPDVAVVSSSSETPEPARASRERPKDIEDVILVKFVLLVSVHTTSVNGAHFSEASKFQVLLCLNVLQVVKSSQVTFIYIALLTIQIVTKQLHNIKMGK